MRTWPWLLFVVACSSANPAGTGDDAPDGADAATPDDAGSDGASDIDASPDASADAAIVDTCAPPTSAFVTDLPPPPGANTSRRRAILQVTDTGALRAFTADLYQNGSFYDANIIQHAKTASGWSQGSVANGGIGLSVGSYMATTGGSDPCIAYSYDYDGTLHLRCSSTGDRTLAPLVRGALSIAATATDKHLVYEDGAGALVHKQFDSDVHPSSTIHPSAWTYGPSSLAIDAAGGLHVAFVTLDSGGPRTVRYATRAAGATTWTTETVDTDTWTGSSGEADTVSLVLVAGRPVIAYHHRATKSMKLAERGTTSFALRTLLAPDPAFSNDVVGQSVALAADCLGRLHVVYQRSLTTDAQPNLRLAYAQITTTGLEHRVFLPMTASTAYAFGGPRHGLGFTIGADGKQYVTAHLNSIFGSAVYVATR